MMNGVKKNMMCEVTCFHVGGSSQEGRLGLTHQENVMKQGSTTHEGSGRSRPNRLVLPALYMRLYKCVSAWLSKYVYTK